MSLINGKRIQGKKEVITSVRLYTSFMVFSFFFLLDAVSIQNASFVNVRHFLFFLPRIYCVNFYPVCHKLVEKLQRSFPSHFASDLSLQMQSLCSLLQIDIGYVYDEPGK